MVLAPCLSQAIVIRHDVEAQRYDATHGDFPPLATLYSIGVHGTLIHSEWVVTAAHAVFCMNPGQAIKVGNKSIAIVNRYSHPNYELGKEHDIALLQLSQPVTHIQPAQLFTEQTEQGREVWFIGAGGTGTGTTGETIGYKDNQGKLRKAQNKIIDVTQSDVVFKFEKGDKGLPLEGVSGNGDSGGPAYIKQGEQFLLLGVSSRADSWFHDVGEYGVTELYTRVSGYSDRIGQVINAGSDKERQQLATQDPFLQPGMKQGDMPELCASIEVR
ncbi:S1 family peptidase [Planctobacterium marinum]|uniref:Peptidase S1 domain-containing protein n=1 Tax=Planctobacterium marinum TaxID=1631968 RepID=A0AA48HLT0_9ALTE|nr:hypothetical protein MACH26_03480 [Planctobacterium marinum]